MTPYSRRSESERAIRNALAGEPRQKSSEKSAEKNGVKRALYYLVGLALFACLASQAADPRSAIISMERPLRMSASVPLPERRIYIGVGRLDGVKPGDIFTAYRDVPMVDTETGELFDFIPVAVGEIEVTNVGRGASVGRALASPDQGSLSKLDYPVMMVGDRIRKKESLPFR